MFLGDGGGLGFNYRLRLAVHSRMRVDLSGCHGRGRGDDGRPGRGGRVGGGRSRGVGVSHV